MLKLMKEWGVSYQQFSETPYEILLEMLAYEDAENEGESRRKK
jgi:hypothetical protein